MYITLATKSLGRAGDAFHILAINLDLQNPSHNATDAIQLHNGHLLPSIT